MSVTLPTIARSVKDEFTSTWEHENEVATVLAPAKQQFLAPLAEFMQYVGETPRQPPGNILLLGFRMPDVALAVAEPATEGWKQRQHLLKLFSHVSKAWLNMKSPEVGSAF